MGRKCKVCNNEEYNDTTKDKESTLYNYSDTNNDLNVLYSVTPSVVYLQICASCLYKHVIKYYPGCCIQKNLRLRYPDMTSKIDILNN